MTDCDSAAALVDWIYWMQTDSVASSVIEI